MKPPLSVDRSDWAVQVMQRAIDDHAVHQAAAPTRARNSFCTGVRPQCIQEVRGVDVVARVLVQQAGHEV
jgi:hypothetical protein